MISYLKKFIPFAVLIAVILFILGLFDSFKPTMPFAWVCYAVFAVISIIVYYFSMASMRRRLGSFMGVFFTSIFAKLVIAAVVVLVFKSNTDTTDVNYILPFAIIYFSFLFFETFELVRLSRKIASEHKTTKANQTKQ